MIKHGQPLDYRNLGVPYFQSTGLFVPLPTKKRKKKTSSYATLIYAMTETPCRPATEEVSHGANVNVAEATQ